MNNMEINTDLIREMHDMGIGLVEFKDIYGDNSFVAELKNRLASAIDEMRHQPDWAEFKDYLKNKIQDMNKLTPYILEQKYNDFQVDNGLSKLADKVAGDYERYIAELRSKTPDDIIRSA